MDNVKLRELYDLVFCSTASTFILGCEGLSLESASNHYIFINGKSINLLLEDWRDILRSTGIVYIGKGDSELHQGDVAALKKMYLHEFRVIRTENQLSLLD